MTDPNAQEPFFEKILENQIFEWLLRKYVQRADTRQRSLGLVYMEAETHDLAKEIARCVASGGFPS